jgi:hypothetical protein
MRQYLKDIALQSFFWLDRAGIHVIPKHFYSPIPDYVWLKENKDLWTGRIDLAGIGWDLDQQLSWLSEMCTPFYDEVSGLEFYENAVSNEWGLGFGPIESQVLHCVVRSLVPRRIIEIGSGISTCCMIHACQKNEHDAKTSSLITCVEPFPRPSFKRLTKVQHIQSLCQAVPKALFAGLEAGDLLFIDSSHAVKTGSDVIRIYLDIIPALPPGVMIHIHDVYLPYLYPRDTLSHCFGWQETVLLAGLLTGNDHLQVLACLSALHYDRTKRLQSLLKDYRPQGNDQGLQPSGRKIQGHFPASIWLRSC